MNKKILLISGVIIIVLSTIALAQLMPDGLTSCDFSVSSMMIECSDSTAYATMGEAVVAHPSPSPTPEPTPIITPIIIEVNSEPTEVTVGTETMTITADHTTTLTIQP